MDLLKRMQFWKSTEKKKIVRMFEIDLSHHDTNKNKCKGDGDDGDDNGSKMYG